MGYGKNIRSNIYVYVATVGSYLSSVGLQLKKVKSNKSKQKVSKKNKY